MARGDRLKVACRIIGSTVTYQHHGIDLGDGTVVHARPHDFRHPSGGGRVVRTSRDDFSQGAAVKVGNEPPARYSSDEVAERALSHEGREGYDLVIDNCEHFTTRCATGRRASRRSGETAGLAASAVAFAVVGAAGPAGMLTGVVAGATMWLGGSAVAATATRLLPPPSRRYT
ncbi:MAG: lecithin retinol acyltransferase family protein [Pirellulales bacterium]